MSSFFWLLLLSLTDAMFAGYRAAAGRNPRLHKVDYYLAAFWTGLFAGWVSAAVVALLVFVLASWQVRGGESWGEVINELHDAASELTVVYGVFATTLLAVMLLWTYPKRQIRELSVVLILGPCTLMRPPWIVVGAAYVGWGQPAWIASSCLAAALVQLSTGRLLDVLQKRAQLRRLSQW